MLRNYTEAFFPPGHHSIEKSSLFWIFLLQNIFKNIFVDLKHILQVHYNKKSLKKRINATKIVSFRGFSLKEAHLQDQIYGQKDTWNKV